jgi:ATP-dependent Clp protease adapter protein ClpS
MQMPWFGRFTHRRDRDCVAPAPRHRSDEEIELALSTLPLYRVILRPGKGDGVSSLIRPYTLTRLVGAERAARILAETARAGAGLVATCPRELAEHYRDELARHALPCAIEPA